ncbi:MAG: RNA 3'-terminal phosphate cyclase [Planctomycetes bacterium]|nr:RNA 3'-terminal phosphate cyclase [Planctomycetota bacterium]
MLTIDGAEGEGGGQVLRTALGLSLVTGKPFLIERIRARRSKPGLQRQHLTAVLAAAEVGGARTEGAELGSQRLFFRPSRLRAGQYRFAIGTAGSTTLVLQTVLPALLMAEGPSTVVIEGGTHNPMAPPFEFVEQAFAPLLHRMGAGLQLTLRRHGFYPAGGGEIVAAIAPAAWQPLEPPERSERPQLRGRILLSDIPHHVAEREASVLRRELGLGADEVQVQPVRAAGPGNVVMLRLQLGTVTEVVTALGERGVAAEDVAGRVVAEARALLAADVPIGEHLADQLLIPLALAGSGSFTTVAPSQHTRTNAQVIEQFLPVRFALQEHSGRPGVWCITVMAAR